jgi:hypothetical protein
MQAGYAAAAGLAKARVALRQDPDWVGCALRVGRCEVVVTVQVLAPRRWRVSSRAVAWPGGRRGVRVKGSRSTVIDPAR